MTSKRLEQYRELAEALLRDRALKKSMWEARKQYQGLPILAEEVKYNFDIVPLQDAFFDLLARLEIAESTLKRVIEINPDGDGRYASVLAQDGLDAINSEEPL